MSLSDRLQATFRQYEAMDHSAPVLRSSIEQSYKNAGKSNKRFASSSRA